MPKSASSSLDDHCASIAETIKDYRQREIARPDAAHVKKWLRQFPSDKRLRIATEMDHLLGQTYFSKQNVKEFLESFIESPELLDGEKPAKFWKSVNFIRVQQPSQSQSDLLNILGGILHSRYGFWSRECGSKSGPYFHLDDFIFTGCTMRREVMKWLNEKRRKKPRLHVAIVALHTYGHYYANSGIKPAVEKLNGTVTYWRLGVIEDRKSLPSKCDVLRPRRVYSDIAIQEYAEGFEHEPALRSDRTNSKLYATESGRRVLESEFLRAGLRIRGFSENPETALRPLGFASLDGFGCGAVVATYRNCPNNCPLAWWWGDPSSSNKNILSKWYPLLPRKYNIC